MGDRKLNLYQPEGPAATEIRKTLAPATTDPWQAIQALERALLALARMVDAINTYLAEHGHEHGNTIQDGPLAGVRLRDWDATP